MDEAGLEARAMKLRAYAPAVLAVVGLVLVYRWVSNRGADEAKPVAGESQRIGPTTTTTPPPALPTPAAQPLPAPAPPQLPGSGPTEVPKPVSVEEAKAHEAKAKKPKRTLEERIAAAKEHVLVIDRRVELMEKEIAELDKQGDTKKAEEQRVSVQRLKLHAEKLRKAIAEGREPE